jgi:hypothetical protein
MQSVTIKIFDDAGKDPHQPMKVKRRQPQKRIIPAEPNFEQTNKRLRQELKDEFR